MLLFSLILHKIYKTISPNSLSNTPGGILYNIVYLGNRNTAYKSSI